MKNEIHVETSGNGPDLVLLHGWAMHSGVWHNIGEQLASRYRLHLVDLPGHGYSPPCNPPTMQQIVETCAEMLPPASIVCGWSLGGQIALELALQKPERVKSLVLVATTPCFAKRADWSWGLDINTIQQFKQNLQQNYLSTINRFLTLQLTGANESNVILKQLRQSFFQYGQPDLKMLQAGLEILLTNDLRKKMARINQSVLLLHGEKDIITPAAAAKWMHQKLQRANLITFPNCGHAPFLSYPEQFIKSLYEL